MTTDSQTKPIGQKAAAHEKPADSVISLREEEYTGESESLYSLALRRLRHDYLSMIAIAIVLVLGAVSFLAPVITDALDISYTRTDSAGFLPIGSAGHVVPPASMSGAPRAVEEPRRAAPRDFYFEDGACVPNQARISARASKSPCPPPSRRT